MLKVNVSDTFVENRSGISKKSGCNYSMNFQVNVFIELNGELRKFPLFLENGQKPYEPGMYLLDPSAMLSLNNFGSLVVTPFAQPVLVLEQKKTV